MWHLDHELDPWFKRVRARREGGTSAAEAEAMSENQDPTVVALRARTGR